MDVSDVTWVLAVLSTGVAAGAMTGHTLLLGRFFDWIFRSERSEMFRQSYPLFVQSERPQLLFDNLFVLSLLVVTAHAAVSWLWAGISVLSVAAAALQWLFLSIFFTSGFVTLENELLYEGNVSRDRVTRFLSLNGRMTGLATMLLLVSLVCLVLTRA